MRVFIAVTSKCPRRGHLVLQSVLASDGHDVHLVFASRRRRETVWDWGSADFMGSVMHPDAWFVSCLTHRDWWQLPQLVDAIPGRAPVVIGGQSADLMASWAYSCCDILAIGDFHGDSRHELYDWIRAGRTGILALGWASKPPPPVRVGNCTTIHLASGCPRGCPYCRITASRPYVQADVESVERAIVAAPTRLVSLYSPSGDHPQLGELLAAVDGAGKVANNSDYHPRAALRLLGSLPGHVRPHYGVEGVSERLRQEIGRRLSVEELRQLVVGRSTHQYYLTGLPGETDEDYDELCDLISSRAAAGEAHWYTMTPLTPIPGTRWEGLSGHLDDDTQRRMARVADHAKATYLQTGVTAIVARPKSKGLHECEVATMRADDKTWLFLLALNAGLSNWKDAAQRWRRACEAAGMDCDELLDWKENT